LRWAARHEAALHLDDLLLRRTRLGLLLAAGAAELLPRLEPVLREELHWDGARWQQECARYRDLLQREHAVPEPA
jgi:glycerol-3-phosphate dehydrogenase